MFARLRPSTHAVTAAYRLTRRNYAIASPGAAVFQIFNRDVKVRQKDRAALDVEKSRTTDYLKDEIAARVADRLEVLAQ